MALAFINTAQNSCINGIVVPDELIKQYELLNNFIQNKSVKFGLKLDEVQLIVVDEPDILETDVVAKVVRISSNILKDYGRPTTPVEDFIDQNPDQSKELRAHLLQLPPAEFKQTQKTFKMNYSDIELEAMICHELGHIILAHPLPYTVSNEQARAMELEADRFAFGEQELRLGLIRNFKRNIIDEVLQNGQQQQNGAPPISLYEDSTPSDDERLNHLLQLKI